MYGSSQQNLGCKVINNLIKRKKRENKKKRRMLSASRRHTGSETHDSFHLRENSMSSSHPCPQPACKMKSLVSDRQ